MGRPLGLTLGFVLSTLTGVETSVDFSWGNSLSIGATNSVMKPADTKGLRIADFPERTFGFASALVSVVGEGICDSTCDRGSVVAGGLAETGICFGSTWRLASISFAVERMGCTRRVSEGKVLGKFEDDFSSIGDICMSWAPKLDAADSAGDDAGARSSFAIKSGTIVGENTGV